ncbi:MAG: heme-binding protein [Bacteroidota bacterium]
MNKFIYFLSFSILHLIGCGPTADSCQQFTDPTQVETTRDSLAQQLNWPDGIQMDYFSGPDLTPCPACLAVAPDGAVFAGVDMMGSLGKDPDKGRIVKLIDCNHDGVADDHILFAKVDNPRGILPIGDQVFVLHTTFSDETGQASGMDLVVFEDTDKDGVADGPSTPLIQNISSPKFLQDRGTDHSTNGIRMGIDGWIYIAVGDFGFHDAIDRDGTKMTMLGGGVVRVRPNGREMEIYTHGLRNIYDVAIDPFMNIFTRGNTNDGGGWDVRFVHHIQSGEYGYPVLFKHFTDEILPALIDVGGGSGTGALFMDEPNWPSSYSKVPLMADWGRNELFIHRVSEDRASFQQQNDPFLKVPQITDVDVDGSGQLFLSAWNGAGYRGNPDIGFILRAVPKDWTYSPFPDLQEASLKELGQHLQSTSAVARLHAQQELLTRSSDNSRKIALAIAQNKDLPLEARVAGIFTYAQIATKGGIEQLVHLCKDEQVQEFALRALTDRLGWAGAVPTEPFIQALTSTSDRVRIAAMVGLGRIGNKQVAKELLKTKVPASVIAPARGTIGLHSIPNSEIIPAHIAVRSLIRLHAVEACVDAIGGEHSDLALWALRYMHDEQAVGGLIAAYQKTESKALKKQILTTLSRLYHKEAPYDGSWWWSTRPDTHGPYYKTSTWDSSPKIELFLRRAWKQATRSEKAFFADLNGKHRMGIAAFGGMEDIPALQNKEIHLGRIANKKGQIERSSIEDIMLAIEDLEGDPAVGKELFGKQGCVACHSLSQGEPLKGPFMGQIGAIMNRDQIAESILKPSASISQGFASVQITAKDNKSYVGFISEESANYLILRNIAGHVFRINTSDILSRKELETSMMPVGLTNPLTFQEFASLVDFLAAQK